MKHFIYSEAMIENTLGDIYNISVVSTKLDVHNDIIFLFCRFSSLFMILVDFQY